MRKYNTDIEMLKFMGEREQLHLYQQEKYFALITTETLLVADKEKGKWREQVMQFDRHTSCNAPTLIHLFPRSLASTEDKVMLVFIEKISYSLDELKRSVYQLNIKIIILEFLNRKSTQ
jgi:hypothetical protein